MKHETIEDYEGVGLYERLDRGPRLDDEFRYGVYTRVSGVGQVPGVPAQPAGWVLDTEENTGLIAVKNDKKQYAIQMLELLTFQRTSAPGADPIVGQASYVLGSVGSPWVKSFVGQGFMVMVATASVPSGNVQAMVTSNPETIATYATKQGGFAMVDGPAELAVAAANFKASQQQPPTCPGGQAWAPSLNKCVPIPGGVENQAAAAKTGTPDWLIFGGVALAVLAVGALVLKS